MASGPGREISRTKIASFGVLVAVGHLVAGLWHPGAAMESTAAAVFRADTLVVAAGPALGPVAPSPASLVTRIDLEQDRSFADLSELLGSVAGLQMARLGGWGATAVPSLRGSSGAQIRFFVDGVPLPEAQSGLAAFSRVPLDRLQAVEVHRGVVPAGLGGVGGAGAINFITRSDTDGIDLTGQFGSFGEVGARATVSGRTASGLSGAVFGAYGHRADNDFTFVDHNQTFHRTDDDTVRVRENAWLREHGAWGSGYWRGKKLTGRARLGFDRRDGGRPGPLAYPSPNAGVRYDRVDAQLHLDWADGLLEADFAGGRANDVLYHPVAGEIGFRPPGVTRSVSEDLYGRVSWLPRPVAGVFRFSTGLDWRGEWQTESIGEVAEPERSRRSVSTFATLTAELAEGRLLVAPAWRWQHTEDNFPQTPIYRFAADAENQRDDISPSLGAVWTVRKARLFVTSHIARAVRIPSWVELFGQRGGIDGNAALQPEEISSADLAVSVRGWRGLSGRVAVFRAVTDDKIIFVQNSQRTSKAINLGRTMARGVELELVSDLPARLMFSGNLTYQQVTDEGPDPAYEGNSLPFLPDFEGHGRLTARLGDWHPWLEGAFMSANYRDRANTELDKAPARARWNLGVSHEWFPDWLGADGAVSLLGEIINLTDNVVYDVEGYPLPGRSWRVAARLRR